jgi:hypothetical protein
MHRCLLHDLIQLSGLLANNNNKPLLFQLRHELRFLPNYVVAVQWAKQQDFRDYRHSARPQYSDALDIGMEMRDLHKFTPNNHNCD